MPRSIRFSTSFAGVGSVSTKSLRIARASSASASTILPAAVCDSSTTAAAAQAQIGLNGASPGTAITVAAGSTVSVTVTGGPGNTTDWVGLYNAGASDFSYLAGRYLNGSTTTPPATGLTTATFNFPL